jgi:hypothetical protein
MTVAVQLSDALFLKQDMPFALGHRFVCKREVSQFYVSIHMLCSTLG